ncbi:HD-GYP domain-containing protein [Sulfuricystis multivorans]|uniref:HD-GYP domain-containing protein n=1 Tax=Sulfuricystis multivorans TaxID=2211108 RepID=UPI000F84C36B|nr:HD-GYP domain-containing protein [Sulfuricystis multivorans]
MANHDSEAQFIDIADLRIGMYVYVDLGWIKHPFALNSFKISSQDQIDTLIELGVKRIRWSPEKSDLEPRTENAQNAVAGNEDAPAVDDAQKFGADGTAPSNPTGNGTAHGHEPPSAAGRQAISEIVAAEAAARVEERRRRQQRLADQLKSLEICEREFSSASRGYRQLCEQVASQPEIARERASAIVGTMLNEMLGQQETAIRLLSEGVGDRTAQHAINVTVIALLLGKALGLDDTRLETLGNGALLHDIGLIELPERLRWFDKHFTTAERRLYQEHVPHGIKLAERMRLPTEQRAIIAQHHELADGRGFPQGLSGEQIDPLARIVALVNLYDNLCNPVHPAQALTPHEAQRLIFAQMRNQFDPKVLMPFIRMMGVYPPGSCVELTDGRFALVVSVNAARPLKPNVIIFDPRIPRDEALVENLEQAGELGIRRSLKPLQLPRAAFDYLSPRQRVCYFFERAMPIHEHGVSR